MRRSVIAATWLALCHVLCAQVPSRFPIGQKAPNFQISTGEADPFRLSDHRGQVVLINFWATWCAPCVAEMNDLMKMNTELQPKGLVLVGVSFDEKEDALQRFSTKHALNFPVGLINPAFNHDYGSLLQYPGNQLVGSDKMIKPTLPSFVLIDKRGRLHWVHIGSLPISELESEVRQAL